MTGINRQWRAILVGLALGMAVTGPAGAASKTTPHLPDPLDYSMSFLSDIRDTTECDLRLVNGRYDFGPDITNPAASCPDSFAWKLFVDIVQAGFWENWSTDRQTWPSDPWPRRQEGSPKKNCCPSLVISNEVWPKHCPVFPGATKGMPAHVVQPAHNRHFGSFLSFLEDKSKLGKWDDVPAILKSPVIGAIQNELIYRNKPMMGYIFDREMYHVEGLADIFDANVQALAAFAPYQARIKGPDEARRKTPKTAEVVFPIKSIMVKVNWLPVDIAPSLGIDPYDKDNPYIIMNLVPVQANDAPTGKKVALKPHILLSIHISSKDLPNWFWTTFEHVANQGRCDWLGCNDSFGYVNTQQIEFDASAVPALGEPARNYTAPHKVTKTDNADLSAFAPGKRYVNVDRISDRLAAIFKARDIATGTGPNKSGRPTQQDAAWRSYRLKGSQTDFVTPRGRPTKLGNSVTEAGFVNSASCITCHSRSSIDQAGLPPLDIFTDTLSDAGIPQSVNGMPEEAWFDVNGYWGIDGRRQAPQIRAVSTDFVFGVRNACPMGQRRVGPAWCQNVKPDAPLQKNQTAKGRSHD